MHDSPSIDDLLAAARASVLHELLPVLPDELHYEALMVANALAIARRMLTDAEESSLAEFDALQRIYTDSRLSDLDPACAAIFLRRRLAADIRRGSFDTPGPRRSAVEGLLVDHALRRVHVGNPKAAADIAGAKMPAAPGTRQVRRDPATWFSPSTLTVVETTAPSGERPA